MKLPRDLETYDERGEYVIKIRKQGVIYDIKYTHHPFDVVGWDGYNFPYAISIHDFEPITGRLHQPPPVHQMFETKAFVVCSFVPRLYDYHPLSIPAPYNHSNIDSDEMIYYVDGDFMSRNNIQKGHITLHPSGIPHGPAPGAYERSIGKSNTDELAVMIDTFSPLSITKAALRIDDGKYLQSWLE
jgi:homogentisate 1,2-dioxygenase